MLSARLDRPCHPSSYMSPRVQILGWVRSAGAALQPENLSFILQSAACPEEHLDQQRPIAGLELTAVSEPGAPYLESVRCLPAAEMKAQVADFYPPDGSTAIEAWLNLPSAAVRKDRARYRLALTARQNGAYAVSNIVAFEVYPEEEWEKPLGGFLYPTNWPVAADFLAVRGWAARKGDEVASVELLLNGRSLGRCPHGLWSPEIFVSLPDAASSRRNAFAALLPRSQLSAHLEAAQRSRAGSSLSAQVVFQSGCLLKLSAPPLFWRSGSWSSLSRQALGEVESVTEESDGTVCISGWCLAQGGRTAEFELRSAAKSVRAGQSAESGLRLERVPRPDIVERFLPCASDQPYGFKLYCNPFILGRVPGPLSLAAWSGAERAALGGICVSSALRRILERKSEWQGKAGRGRRTAAHSLLTLAAAAKRLAPPITVQPARPPGSGVLFASHNLCPTEGAPRVLFGVVAQVLAENPQAPVTVLASCDGKLREELEALGATVEVLRGTSVVGQTWERYHESRDEAAAVIQRVGPETVYANTTDCFWAVDAARRTGVSSLWAVHECVCPSRAYPDLDPRLRMQYCDILSTAGEFVFVSRASEEIFRPYINGARSTVVPNGVDLRTIDDLRAGADREKVRARLGISDGSAVVSIVGTTAPHKGQDVFLSEMALLRKRLDRQLVLFIVGARPGRYLSELVAHAEELGLSEAVHFVAETTEVADYYLASDAVVVASRVESSPLVPLEAFAFCVPLASTTNFGLAEQIRSGRNAVVFNLDVAGSMASAVDSLLSDRSLRERIVVEARKDVEQRFDRHRSLEQHASLVCRPRPPA